MADLQEMPLRAVGYHPNSEPGRARSKLDLGETTTTEGRGQGLVSKVLSQSRWKMRCVCPGQRASEGPEGRHSGGR